MSTETVGDALYARWNASKREVLAVLGVAKNVGKTIVLTTFLQACRERGEACAALSIGRDGERYDALNDLPKPPIHLAAGMLAVVARSSLAHLTRVALLGELPVQSAVGELVLIRALGPARVELVGPRFATDIPRILKVVRQFHQGRVLIDGALDRLAGLVDHDIACILATGAGVDRRLETVVLKTQNFAARLALPPAPAGHGLRVIDGVCDEIMAAQILAEAPATDVLVRSPLAITAGAFAALRTRRRVYAERAFTLLGCSINAFAPTWSFAPRLLLEKIHQRTGLWSCDVFGGAIAA